jgi:hypothetical protein
MRLPLLVSRQCWRVSDVRWCRRNVLRQSFLLAWQGGRRFVASMLTMAAAASCLAFMKHQMNNVFGGLLTIYMVATAWATARRRDGGTGIPDWLGFLFALAIGVLSVIHGFQKATGRMPFDGSPAFMDIFMGLVMLLAALGDLRMLLRRISGRRRIARHLWRMCFGGFIATGSISWASNKYFPPGCADHLCSWSQPFCH